MCKVRVELKHPCYMNKYIGEAYRTKDIGFQNISRYKDPSEQTSHLKLKLPKDSVRKRTVVGSRIEERYKDSTQKICVMKLNEV